MQHDDALLVYAFKTSARLPDIRDHDLAPTRILCAVLLAITLVLLDSPNAHGRPGEGKEDGD